MRLRFRQSECYLHSHRFPFNTFYLTPLSNMHENIAVQLSAMPTGSLCSLSRPRISDLVSRTLNSNDRPESGSIAARLRKISIIHGVLSGPFGRYVSCQFWTIYADLQSSVSPGDRFSAICKYGSNKASRARRNRHSTEAACPPNTVGSTQQPHMVVGSE